METPRVGMLPGWVSDDVPVRTFPQHPIQKDLGNRRRLLLGDYRYGWTHEGRRMRITAPAGFCHDGASVPGVVWSLVPPHPMDRAAVPHDLAYWLGGRMGRTWQFWSGGAWRNMQITMTRKESDRLFGRMLREDPQGPRRWRRRAAYRAVRTFGWTAFDQGGSL